MNWLRCPVAWHLPGTLGSSAREIGVRAGLSGLHPTPLYQWHSYGVDDGWVLPLADLHFPKWSWRMSFGTPGATPTQHTPNLLARAAPLAAHRKIDFSVLGISTPVLAGVRPWPTPHLRYLRGSGEHTRAGRECTPDWAKSRRWSEREFDKSKRQMRTRI